LDDQAVFAALLSGVRLGPKTQSRFPNHWRYPTPERGTIFDQQTGIQTWLDLAMLHLLAASDLPIRTKVTSIALGTTKRKLANPPAPLWLDGLERLTGLTHIDLQLTVLDREIDLGILTRFPDLTHLRTRGSAMTGELPSMEKLKVIDGTKFRVGPEAYLPALESIRGQITVGEPLNPDAMPNLVDVEARGGVRLVGFETLNQLWCSRGVVEAIGCRRINHLRVGVTSFSAPDLRHIGLLDRASPGVDVSQLETLDELQLNRTSKFMGGTFPEGTTLLDSKVVLWGPALTDLGNIGELPGLEILSMPRVTSPVSLETLRHATDLRVLDIRNSPGITDLSPLVDLPNLEVLVISDPERREIPPELEDRIQRIWRNGRRLESAKAKAVAKADVTEQA